MSPITIAVAKGYLMAEAVQRFAKIGITFEDDLAQSRKLFTTDITGQYRLLQIRPWDVPVYVAQGAADLGISGFDVLEEKDDEVIRLMDLGFGACRLILAGAADRTFDMLFHNIRVATKYPNATEKYFRQKGIKANIIKLYGAIELAPLTGLSDIISDLTATGKTLAENNLSIMETIYSSTAQLITNQASFRLKDTEIRSLVDRLKSSR
ncbi:ATP phosphoribosyltransferase [bacterium]|nr:ATP phosphoribosyltransferase [bacterium]